MNAKKRTEAIRLFNKNPKVKVMLMSVKVSVFRTIWTAATDDFWKCGGVGLNLTRGNRVISLDLGLSSWL